MTQLQEFVLRCLIQGSFGFVLTIPQAFCQNRSPFMPQCGGPVNVLEFIPAVEHDAIRDGISTYDATDDIQAAINSLSVLGGTVFFPSGRYYIGGTLYNYDTQGNGNDSASRLYSLVLLGEADGGPILTTSPYARGSVLFKDSPGDIFRINILPDGSTNIPTGTRSKCRVDGINFLSSTESTGVNGIVGYWSNGSFSHCSFLNLDKGIDFESAVVNPPGSPYDSNYSDGNSFYRLNFYGMKAGAIAIQGADYTQVQRIGMGSFGTNAKYGIKLRVARGIHIDSILANGLKDGMIMFDISYCSNLQVRNIHCEGSATSGRLFQLFDTKSTVLDGGFCHRVYGNGGSGFRLIKCNNITVSNYYVYEPNDAGPYVSGVDYHFFDSSTNAINLRNNYFVDANFEKQNPLQSIPSGITFAALAAEDLNHDFIHYRKNGAVAFEVNSVGDVVIDGDVSIGGDVNIDGWLSKGGGSFKIDHPLDPENKYLIHSFVESSDMMNIYNGIIRLDANGQAIVFLPDWFEPLNRDFRYQLTAIGAACPNLHISDTIASGKFSIAGGEPGVQVSWQVTGIRQDDFANTNRKSVEAAKDGIPK